jgi:hypothetical protein
MHVKQLSALSTVLSTVACTDVKDRLVMKSKLTFSINVNRWLEEGEVVLRQR